MTTYWRQKEKITLMRDHLSFDSSMPLGAKKLTNFLLLIPLPPQKKKKKKKKRKHDERK